jgi:deazaflavin-dependent oxidoreductase (nitroreductase family)
MIVPRPVLRAYWALHKAVDRVSGGRLGTVPPSASRLGVLFLTTTGHRTGARRRNGLYFVQDGPAYVVVGSNAGAGVEPAWWRNLQATPEATIQLGGRTTHVRARPATPDERARLWPEFVRRDRSFGEYERATAWQIPVVILDPGSA